ncbi:MAG: putative porin [Gammaproteobacteria bacterium]
MKEEIREQVRKELKNDVLKDVADKAKAEKWGTPDALPKWVNKIKIAGDVRLRDELAIYADDNVPIAGPVAYFDVSQVNSNGAITRGKCLPIFRSADWTLSRIAIAFVLGARIALQAALTEKLKFVARVATSNSFSPVSTNQTLGNTGQGYQVQLDQAYVQYDATSDGSNWGTFMAGAHSQSLVVHRFGLGR